ncbi:MAG TPA: hypothetical protein VIP98_21135 [Microlunatus sp.]
MTPSQVNPALPAGSRLLHIGLPKTGTTTLQRGAAVNRTALLEHGVCYPGKGFNHRDAVAALMQRPLGWRDNGATLHGQQKWQQLIDEVRKFDSRRSASKDSSARRAFISHEFVCESTDRQVERFADEIGRDRLQVAVTLRGFADLLPTNWQQFVKSGSTRSFDSWLKIVLNEKRAAKDAPTFVKRNDQAAIIRRWTRIVGPERVSVVIADKRQPDFLINSFEDLLDLPRGTMSSRPVGGYAANRGLSSAEVELVRRLNTVVREQGYDWRRYTDLIRHGVIARMQECRRPAVDEPSPVLPEWAATKALARAQKYVAAIEESGCRVIGDLALLTADVRTVPRVEAPQQLPVDAVFEAVAGLISAADGRGPFFDQAADGVEGRRTTDPRLERFAGADETLTVLNAHRATRHLTGGAIGAVLVSRMTERIRRLVGRS